MSSKTPVPGGHGLVARFLGNFRVLDAVIFVGMLGAAVLAMAEAASLQGDVVRVTADGSVYEYTASVDGTYSVEGAAGTTVLQVKDGQVRILDSACPSKTCVQQGTGSPLVCLPNKVIVTLERKAGGEGVFDAVAQ